MQFFATPIILLGLLVGPFLVLKVLDRIIAELHFSTSTTGSIGISTVLVFTGIGHFFKSASMAEMLPTFFPEPLILIYISGALEILLGVAVLFGRIRKPVGWLIIGVLVVLLPVNIFAAINQVGPGGHQLGSSYLWIRVPLQFVLIGWAYWFCIHLVNKSTNVPSHKITNED